MTPIDCNPCVQSDWVDTYFVIDSSQWGWDVTIEARSFNGTFEVDDMAVLWVEAQHWTGYGSGIEVDDEGQVLKLGDFRTSWFTAADVMPSGFGGWITYKYAFPDQANNSFTVRAYRKSNGAQINSWTESCTNCTRGWTRQGIWIDAAYVGQEIGLRFTRNSGTVLVDDVGFGSLEAQSLESHPSFEAGDPFDTSTGQLSHSHTDLVVPGKGLQLEFTRSYHSMFDRVGDLGHRWSHSYSGSLDFHSTIVFVRYPTGTAMFWWNNNTWKAPPGVFDTLVKNVDNSYTLTTVTAVTYNFSATGKLTSIVDRNGWTTTISYDGDGFISEVEDAGGRSLVFTTDDDGRITEVEDPLGRTVSFGYDAEGDLVEVTDVKGGTTTYEYSDHYMTSLTDANDNVANETIYDDVHRVVEQLDAAGGTTCVYYGTGPVYDSDECDGVSPAPAAGQTIVVDPRGKKTTYDFDTRFRTTSVTDHNGNVTAFSYSTGNRRTCVTDPLGHKTGYTYDSKANVTGVIDAENTNTSCALKTGGVKWTYTYTAKNDIDLETDPLGRTTDYVYDANGNLTEVIRKDASSNSKLRTCFTRPTSGTDKGLVTELIESTTLTNCTGNKTKFTYDTYGNQTEVIDPRFSSQGTPSKTTMTYDLGGRRLTVDNELGHTTTFTYDNQNNVLSVEDELANKTVNTYDAKGNLKTVTDANRKVSGTAESGASCGAAGTGDGDDDDSDTVVDDGSNSMNYG
jgi:YD repeat-containing protein